MLQQKLALDTEIAVYKGLIDAMDKRLRWEEQMEEIGVLAPSRSQQPVSFDKMHKTAQKENVAFLN